MGRAGTTCKTTKGYPRVTAGPLRHRYVHRVVAAALIGRELTPDEEVHHKDGNKLNFNWNNLMVVGRNDHGWITTKQVWFMRNRDEKLKAEWDSYMNEEAQKQTDAILVCRSNEVAWTYTDGHLEQEWDDRNPLF